MQRLKDYSSMQGQDTNTHHFSWNTVSHGQRNTSQTRGTQQRCFENVGRGRSRKDHWKFGFLALWSWVAEAWVDRKLCFSEVWVKMQDIFTYCKIDNTFFWSPLVWNYFKQKPEKIHSYAHMEWLLIWRTLFIKAKQISYNGINIFFNFRNSFLCVRYLPLPF